MPHVISLKKIKNNNFSRNRHGAPSGPLPIPKTRRVSSDKTKWHRAWPVCENGKEIGRCPMSIPSAQPKRAFHLRKRHRASPVAESSNDIGLGPMSIPKLNLPPETLWFISCASREAVLGRFWAAFEDF